MEAAQRAPTSGAPLPDREPVLEVRAVRCSYPSSRRWRPGRRAVYAEAGSSRPAVLEVSLRLEAGETVALVGESGCGKTTLARAVTGVFGPTSGEIRFAGTTLASTVEKRPPALRREIQYVFQNADASLNPRQRVSTIIGRPLELFFGLRSGAKRQRIDQLLTDVYLDPGCAERFPRQLSGGEQQRVAIARALAAEPRLLICDEILTALDVSVQAGIVELLGELQDRHALSYLFISHDLSVVRSIADRVIVLYCGEVMESGTPEELFGSPKHPYTRLLISSIPDVARRGRTCRLARRLLTASTTCTWRSSATGARSRPAVLSRFLAYVIRSHREPPW